MLSAEERRHLFGVPVDLDALARVYTFEPRDLSLIEARREERNRLGSVDEVPDPESGGSDEDEADVAVGGLSYRVASLRLCLSFEKHRSTRFRRA